MRSDLINMKSIKCRNMVIDSFINLNICNNLLIDLFNISIENID
ncbi:hypothetical protein CNEO4_40005 [Clostridium neonatale]|nr:hypothetical protein CNEO_130109 [Clostridium neonatale]CAI3549610.1 hypothetical protein CNEO4_100004 [Clostridium neonatale]CAI3636869.1 hypothetical protein CNEO3_70004 [Clostridium neonatale]CAI3663127.1 hypothetical protein CNEO4_40005 [Clostridium neonatale]